jgi:2-polyprenyl-3-methyl-5-hydroxy-6-metoxy-1,4-benzoquinol methylase
MERDGALDNAKVESFVSQVMENYSATMTTMLVVLGDRLGLFKDLAQNGPTTSEELAELAGVSPRYTLEWLGGMVNAGYVEYDLETEHFTLPPEHVPALAEEGGPFFLGGAHQMLPAMVGIMDPLTEAFRKGGGVHQSQYSDHFWDGMERFTMGWFENLLVPEWIPSMPEVQTKLETGASVADVGCGRGRALVRMARQYPRSTFTGYDVYPPSISRATMNARSAGVDDRIRFEARDVSHGLPKKFDIIFTFDVVHDAVDPVGLLRSVRDSLNEGGIYVCLDINCSAELKDNDGMLGAMFHGFSMFYCMTTSLAHDGEGLGTLGFHEDKVRELCEEAGFSSVRRIDMENPFNSLFEIRR